jgi:hypothetical protein
VISTVAKVMEKISHNQLYLYLQDENLLSTSQHSFRPGRYNQNCPQMVCIILIQSLTVLPGKWKYFQTVKQD